MFSIGRRGEVFEQFNLVSGRFEHCDRDFRARHAGDFASEIASLMCAMRKLEAENILPESERPLEVRNRYAGVIGGKDAKRCGAHAQQKTSNAQRPTSNVEFRKAKVDRPLRRAMLINSASPTLFLTSSKGLLDPPIRG